MKGDTIDERVLSVNVGKPTDVDWRDRKVHTGIWKSSVNGPVMVRRLNIDGDGQGDLAGHGGEQRAVLVYQRDSYRHWEKYFGLDRLEPGSFSENLTVSGLPDAEVCIGDRYRIGEALVEVTQPRVTCYRIGIRLGQPQLPGLLVAHRRPGFYLRVIEEGHVRADDAITLVSGGRHSLTVAEVDGLLYLPDPDLSRLRDAVDVPALSPGWRQSFQEILEKHEHVGSAPNIEIGHEPEWQGFIPLNVSRLVQETADVLSITLDAPAGRAMPIPLPGQYLTLRLDNVTASAPLLRCYSISSSDPTRYRISVKHEADGLASSWLHANVHIGSKLMVAAPRGTFTLNSRAANPVVLVSAGIGVTPVLAMLHTLAAHDSQREIWWLHAARDPVHQSFTHETSRLLAGLPRAHALTCYSATARTSPSVMHGRLDQAALASLEMPADATAYICGPPGFMDDVSAALVRLGITDVRTEMFGALEAINPGVIGESGDHHPHLPEGLAGTGPVVSFGRSGLAARWAADRYASLLELAEACDVPTRWSCRSGVCHLCQTPVIAGQATYFNEPLVPPPAGDVLLCCAEPAGDLTLDM
jgi:ferredoxin-NADP reductase/MOSC domain-containing protein YiiM/ferredoxin